MSTAAVRCEDLSKRFGAVQALDGVSLEVPRGHITALLGPSGCGKTTLLRLIAGFEAPDAGSIAIGDEPVSDGRAFVPPEARRVGMVFQDYALFPHLNVRANVAFGLPRRAGATRARVDRLLSLVGLEGYGARFPHELSGGEQQRVALARTLAPNPRVVLLDEPFSNLDASLRREVRGEVKSILKKLDSTVVLVTHDQEEAFELGERVAVLDRGRLAQVGSPFEVYEQPRTPFVARFLGKADFIPARLTPDGLETELGRLSRPETLPAGETLHLMVRPEHLELSPEPSPDGAAVRVVANKSAGLTSIHCLELDSGQRVHSARLGPFHLPEGETVYARLRVPKPVLFADLDVSTHCLFGPGEDPYCFDKPSFLGFPAQRA